MNRGIAVSMVVGSVMGLGFGAGAQQFANFEDVVPGSTFVSGDSFASQGVIVNVSDLVTSSFTTSGFARVIGPASDLTGPIGSPSNELQVNNVTTEYVFDSAYNFLSFQFGEFGGANTFEINGSKVEFGNMAGFFAAGPTIGGVTFSAALSSGNRGTVFGTGSFSSFAIGGQELFVDNIRVIPTPASAAILGLGGLASARRRR